MFHLIKKIYYFVNTQRHFQSAGHDTTRYDKWSAHAIEKRTEVTEK